MPFEKRPLSARRALAMSSSGVEKLQAILCTFGKLAERGFSSSFFDVFRSSLAGINRCLLSPFQWTVCARILWIGGAFLSAVDATNNKHF
jgi:hypothetical protein